MTFSSWLVSPLSWPSYTTTTTTKLRFFFLLGLVIVCSSWYVTTAFSLLSSSSGGRRTRAVVVAPRATERSVSITHLSLFYHSGEGGEDLPADSDFRMTTTYSSSQEVVESLRKELNEKDHALERAISGLERAIKEIEQLKGMEQELQRKINSLEHSKDTIERKWRDAQDEWQASQNKWEDFQTKYRGMEEELARSTEQVQALTTSLSHSNQEIQQQQSNMEALEKELAQQKQKNDQSAAQQEQYLLAKKKQQQEEEELRLEKQKKQQLQAEQKRKEIQLAKDEEMRQRKLAQEQAAALRKQQAEERKRKQLEEMEIKRLAAIEAKKQKEEQQRKAAEAETLKRKQQQQQERRNVAKPTAGSSSTYAAIVNEWKINSQGQLVGTVIGHPTINDGDTIETSPLADPKLATRQGVIVNTQTGSKYKLGTPSLLGGGFSLTNVLLLNNDNNKDVVESSNAVSKDEPAGDGSNNEKESEEEKLNAIAQELNLTGETIGETRKYLLSGKPRWSTNGRSQVWTAYKSHVKNERLPTNDPPVAIKISDKTESMEREYKNYKKITSSGLGNLLGRRGSFVIQYEFLPSAGGTFDKKNDLCALVMERGMQDLASYIYHNRSTDSKNGGLKGRTLRDAAYNAAKCVEAIHQSNMVWTDLKSENLVVCCPSNNNNDITVKGIDLESAMPYKSNPIDYSPEACPPEFALAYQLGKGSDFVLDYSYDVWSYGMLLFEMSVGKGFFDNKANTPAQLMNMLANDYIHKDDTQDKDYDNIHTVLREEYKDIINDDKLLDLISKCLSKDPKKRPSIQQILLHPFFLLSSTPFW